MSTSVEEVWIIALTSSNQMISCSRLFRGTVDACLFHPRDVFRHVIQKNASCFILAHNHPSGELEPSAQDIKVTRQMIQASRFMQIEFYDHIIFSPYSYVSMADLGYF